MTPEQQQILDQLEKVLDPETFKNIRTLLLALWAGELAGFSSGVAHALIDWAMGEGGEIFGAIMRALELAPKVPAVGEAAAGVGWSSLAVIGAGAFALVAIGFAAYMIGREVATVPTSSSSGSPCGAPVTSLSDPRAQERRVRDNSVGGKRSWNNAMEKAQNECNDAVAALCSGASCADGKTCKPAVSVQRFDQANRVFWTRTKLWFNCPCECQ